MRNATVLSTLRGCEFGHVLVEFDKSFVHIGHPSESTRFGESVSSQSLQHGRGVVNQELPGITNHLMQRRHWTRILRVIP